MDELEKIKKEVLNDEEIKEFIFKHNIDTVTFHENLGKFIMQYQNNVLCKKCDGKMECLMDVEGMQSYLDFYHGKIQLRYKPCQHEKVVSKNNLEILHFPKDTFENKKMFKTESRALVLKYMIDFQKKYAKGEFTKGLFIHGLFGTGKSFLLFRLAELLASKNVKVILAYYPDLVRSLKASIGNGTLEREVNKLKTVDILMLDDVGGEMNSAFMRDEVLGAILNYRMMSNLPICMTSNSSLEFLREHFMESTSDSNQLNSDRIIERMRYMMHEIELKDKNHRI